MAANRQPLGPGVVEVPWIELQEAAPLFGLTFESAKNAIYAEKFPVRTYKLGRKIVVDRVVIEEYFRLRREEGLAGLAHESTKSGFATRR